MTGDPRPAQPGDPSAAVTGDPLPAQPGDPSAAVTGDPVPAEPGDPSAAVTGDPVLRPSRPDDLPALVDIFVDAFQSGYRTLLPRDVLSRVDRRTVTGWFAAWNSHQRRPPVHTVVAEIDAMPRGFVRFGDGSTDDTAGVPPPDAGAGQHGGVGYIAALYVHPGAAGRGLGRRLLEHAVTALAADGYGAVTLWVFAGNARARGLYASAGFVPDGTEVTDPQWRVPQIRLRREGIGA